MDTPSDDRPLHDVLASQESEERHNWISAARIITILMVGGFALFLIFHYRQLMAEGKIVLGLTATILALLLACAYFFAFRFFDDLFYLFLSIAWLANAAYLPFELLFKDNCEPGQSMELACFKFSLYTFSIAFISSVSFYLATLIKPKGTTSYSAEKQLGIWISGVFALTGASYLVLSYFWPTSSFNTQFTVYTVPGTVFAAYGLFRVGQHITGILKPSTSSSDRSLSILSFTFYAYALLQLTYPFKSYMSPMVFPGLICFAFACKTVNLYHLVKVLLTVKYPEFVQQRSELEALQERLKRQSQLAAIGAIAASIEHDMKTPLSGISTKLETMRRQYTQGKIRGYIEKLEADKNRIAAIAKVVPFMRGAEDFYDRDRFMDKVSINELINMAIKAVKVEMSLDTTKFFFRIYPDPKAASKSPDLYIRAYIPMMEQMLVNLLKNGIEAIRETGKDRGVITIRIAAIKHIPPEEAADYNLKPWAKWVKIEIEDNGCGIPAENLGKLTSLFTTKTDRKANGGIGLYIAMRLLKIHEGCMGINSTEGKGTTITLYLPEWAAYQAYVLGHPDAMKESYDFDDDIAAVHTSEGDLQETHAIAE